MFEFGKFDLGADSKAQLYPLRHFKDCTYFGHNLMTRTIANTYYVEAPTGDMDFKFVYGMLPVTDTRCKGLQSTQFCGSHIIIVVTT